MRFLFAAPRLLISAETDSLGLGFSCEINNACSGTVAFSNNIVTSNGSNGLTSHRASPATSVHYVLRWDHGICLDQ